MIEINRAPGHPGAPANWTVSRKDGVGTACNAASRVWFTLSEGILNEVFYPRIDCACTRDMQMVVTDGKTYFSEEKRHTTSNTDWMETGVPAFHIVNVEQEGKYRIEKFIHTDPQRPVLLQLTRFIAQQGKISDYHLYALLAPQLANEGALNTAWVGDYKGHPALLAEHNGVALALLCSAPWLKRSAGYVGVSDGWQDLNTNKLMTWHYNLAEKGNVALTGEIDLEATEGEFVLALGFGRTAQEAAHHAQASLTGGYESAWQQYRREWHGWQKELLALDTVEEHHHNPYRISMAVMRCHESNDFPGSLIASLSIPWGFSLTENGNDAGGYHLVWPRDAFHASTALIAAGAYNEARRLLQYLETTQEPGGNWPKSMWLDGSAIHKGVELDEVAAPLVLIDLVRRERILPESEIKRLWPMVHKAAGFIVRNGPVTKFDRWEDQSGFSPYTLAVCVAGLLSAAEILDEFEPDLSTYLRQTADSWNDSIERWTYITDTTLARDNAVDGYYMRIAPCEPETGRPLPDAMITEKQCELPNNQICAKDQISPDALALVRFGLRAPDDPRILSTLRVIDSILKVETPLGPCWRRFNGDGYGEKIDGAPFDKTGIGRLWPILTGERAHYELAAGKMREARRLLAALEKFGDRTGLLSEQIWDGADIPEQGLFLGKATGSARPLVWAHAEHVKLMRSLQEESVFDMPPQTVQRYLIDKTLSDHVVWRMNLRASSISPGKILRIESTSPVQVHWSTDNWLTVYDNKSCNTGLGIHVTDLETQELAEETQVAFTLYWIEENRWEGRDFIVDIAPAMEFESEALTERMAEKRAIYKVRRTTRSPLALRRAARARMRALEEGEGQ